MNTKSLGFTLTLAMAVMLIGYVNPSVAAKDKGCPDSDHPSCGDGGGETGDVVTYDVVLLGPVDGSNVGLQYADWIDQQGGSIGNPFSPGVDAGTLNLAAFSIIFNMAVQGGVADGDGGYCFSATDAIRDGGVWRMRRDQIEVGLWIDGRTSDGIHEVVYTFWLTGSRPYNWLPDAGNTAESVLTNWEIEPANGQADLVPLSCTGEGKFPEDVVQWLFVTANDPA